VNGLLLLSTLLLFGQTVRLEQEHPRFSLQLPSGYVLVKQEEHPKSFFYMKENRPVPGVRFVVTISILSGRTWEGEVAQHREELAQELASALPGKPPVSSTVRTIPWKDLQIEVLDLRFTKENERCLASMAFIPTMEKAVRVEVLGPEKLETIVDDDLREIVKSFEGRPSWILPEHVRLSRLAVLPAILSLIAFPVYILAWLIFFRRKPLRLRIGRTAFMLVMGLLMLLPPVIWQAWLKTCPISPPGLCTWPVPIFFAAPWLMWATARWIGTARAPASPESPGTPGG
jgi:hypothetical protein